VLRYWCITTLGWRWTIRVVTVPGMDRIVGGPYRWFPHPNYVAVMSEAILLPLAFGAWTTLLVVVPLQLLALWRRVRFEEGALGDAHRALRADA
jgi:methyltransferase